MKPKIGQVVLIDPEDKLELRDKESTVGTVLKVDRNQSTLLVQVNPEKKIVVPNKYLYKIEMDEKTPPYVIVERSLPRVRFTENDLSKLETVATLIDAMAQRLDHYIISGSDRFEMLDVCSFAKSNLLYMMSKIKRLVAGEMETEARDSFINRFHKYADDDEDPRDIKDDTPTPIMPDEKSKELAMKVIENIMKTGIGDDIGTFDEHTLLNAEILKWYEKGTSGDKLYDKVATKQFMAKTMETATDLFNKNVTIEQLFGVRCENLVGSEHNMRNLISSMEIMFKSSTEDLINIPILIVMDPTCLIELLIKRHPNKFITYQDIIDAIKEAGSVKALLTKENLDLPHVVKSIVVPIFPFDEELTPTKIMNEFKDIITSICVEISEHTDIELLDDDEIQDVGLDDTFILHLPVTLTSMSVKPFEEGGNHNG